MDDLEFDAMIARAGNPHLVPGVYNYCDRRCPRCRFSERCLSNLESRREAEVRASDDPIEASGRSLMQTFDVIQIIARRQGIDLSTTPEEDAAFNEKEEVRRRRVEAEATVTLARHYSMTSWPITRALMPVVLVRGDAKVIDAVETIETLSTAVSSKTFRAAIGTLEDDFDPADLQSDANGSAKIARLLIDESRQAWKVLMETGRATADGVPARLVRILDDLDAAIAARFPRAMEFVRPGFDTEPDERAPAIDMDPALAVAPQGHA